MPSVPELVHNMSPSSRLPQSEMLHFGKLMQAADATTDSVFLSRKRKREQAETSPCAIGPEERKRVTLGFGDSGDEDEEEEGVAHDTAIARALVRTIAATTGVEPPDRLKTTHEAITWASKAILDARTAAITTTRRERYSHALDPEQTLQAMTLVEKLNKILAGPLP